MRVDLRLYALVDPERANGRDLAVLARLVAQKQLDREQTICAIISETGLKTEGDPPSRAAVAFELDSLRRLVAERLA